MHFGGRVSVIIVLPLSKLCWKVFAEMGALADIRGDGAELGASVDWNIETVIDWKRIVSMYYQMNGKKDEPDEVED